MKKLKVGVVGAGNWGKNIVASLGHVGCVDLECVADADEQTRVGVRLQYPDVFIYGTVEEMLEETEVDAVVVAVPSMAHYRVAMRALEAGKHVFVEKPMTTCSDCALEMVKTAKEYDVTLTVGHLLLFHERVEEMVKAVHDRVLGGIHYMHSQRLNHGVVRVKENAWWSLAPHDVSVALHLFRELPVKVMCRGCCSLTGDPPEDVVFGTLEFPSGRSAHIHCSWLDCEKVRKIVVVGEKGSLEFDDVSEEHKLRCEARPGMLVKGSFSDGRMTSSPLTDEMSSWASAVLGEDAIGKNMDSDQKKAIRRQIKGCQERRLSCDGIQGYQVVKILEAGQKSLESGESVDINWEDSTDDDE